MAVTTPQIARPGTFGSKLHGLLKERQMGARTLAKLVADKHGGSVEDRRRTIIRWLRGTTPFVENRHMVEDVLEVPRDSLKGDDEDEESDPVASLLFELHRAIDALFASRENVLS
jgi:transcriptional regulator with XRE-family HTH domain